MADKESELKYEEILIFVTGADEVPALGFTNKPSIDFFHQEAGRRRMPYASTCMMCLYLPRGITQEDELQRMLFQAIRDSMGFGKCFFKQYETRWDSAKFSPWKP